MAIEIFGIDGDGAPVKLLDVGMVGGGVENAGDDAALLGHAQALGGAGLLKVRGRTFRVHGRSIALRVYPALSELAIA